MAILGIDEVTFRRGNRTILSDVSWTVQPQEHWALLGANGSGKTSLLKIVTGYEWPTEGRIEVLGQTFGQCDVRELRKRIGWVSSALQQRAPSAYSALNVVLTGFEAALAFYRAFTQAETRRAAETLAMLGCGHVADQSYQLLSQGEQQRVLIARALVNRPALLILDEPCAGLDPAAREAFLEDLNTVAGRADAPTIILVTHHVEEIFPAINRVLVLKDGLVFAVGTKEDVLTSETMSTAFDFTCRVETDGDSCYLRRERESRSAP